MFRTLIIGTGRAGYGLHWPVMRRLREGGRYPELFDPAPVVAVDPVMPEPPPGLTTGPLHLTTLERARSLLDPERTVVHLCTPPVARVGPLRELADAGFRRVIVEKPLAADRPALRELKDLAAAEKLRLAVVSPWLASSLTERLAALVAEGRMGALRRVAVRQHKPRWRRTLADNGHPTAFDIEVPHSLGVCLRLAGDATVERARLHDMRLGTTVVPAMGTAEAVLRHHPGRKPGATSHIVSDLTAPVRERRIDLQFDRGRVVGYYPHASDDHYAQLLTSPLDGPETREIFPDDALSAYLAQAYRDFLTDADLTPAFDLATRVVELLADAKDAAGRTAADAPGAPATGKAADEEVAHAG
ncbi:hypothetical protein ACTWP5_09645 [Streptomyces sp. 4N509B]|uniref:hypothetical protein n=1 Tax=Streptomyces sp. 4N509B TaxID=3457413 RepID=UPI003FD59535